MPDPTNVFMTMSAKFIGGVVKFIPEGTRRGGRDKLAMESDGIQAFDEQAE